MTTFRLLAVLLLLAADCVNAHEGPLDAQLTILMTKALADYPNKEALVFTVDYPPGAIDPLHRHDAHAFVYVLEGSIIMQVEGGDLVTLGPGQTFYEGPDDLHTVGRNASMTEPAKFLVILLKETGAPPLILVD
jgi:quercetin dioxygenase-like cupin family protein